MRKPGAANKPRTDGKRVDSLTDRQIDFSDIPEVTQEMFACAVVRRGLKPLPRKIGQRRNWKSKSSNFKS